jgi:hypothetical protein
MDCFPFAALWVAMMGREHPKGLSHFALAHAFPALALRPEPQRVLIQMRYL